MIFVRAFYEFVFKCCAASLSFHSHVFIFVSTVLYLEHLLVQLLLALGPYVDTFFLFYFFCILLCVFLFDK